MGVISVIRGRIRVRHLVLFRADPGAVGPLVPVGMRAVERRGEVLVGVCHTRMEDDRPGWYPLSVGQDHLTWRIPAELEGARNGSRRCVWVPRRDTSSWFGAHCAGRLSRGRWRLSRFDVDESPGGVTIEVRRGEELEFLLRAETTDRLRGSTFYDVEEAREHLAKDGPARPPFALAPGFDHLELEADAWSIEPLQLREVRARPFDDTSLFPAGTLEPDCVLRLSHTGRERRTELPPELREDGDMSPANWAPSG
jgi:hypothetical protein